LVEPEPPIAGHGDPLKGVYVPPTGGNGSTGAWVRQHQGQIFPQWWGAVGNCTAVGAGTDDYAALQASITFAGKFLGAAQLKLGNYRYRCGTRLVVTEGVHIEGIGHYENPASIAGILTRPTFSCLMGRSSCSTPMSRG
jgi:hypothetical protein